ncbi:MAG TPA: DHA2 family efflux MFS transporter permease subunit [Myxococcota bacterium]|jgi:DHA2 family multidrug resistance protein
MDPYQVTGSKVLITVAVMCGALMSVLDISIVNVALSDIRASFGTPLDQIAWVSTGYAMANITVIPMSGWLGRKFGLKRYFAGSLLLFTIASALCGAAWNLPSLVMFRVLQGIGGGAIIPTAQTILFSRYPPREQGMAGALFGLGSITGPLLGPTIGGYLIDWFSWHWIFLINVPIGLAAAFIAYRNIEQPAFTPTTAKVDSFGIGLLAVGMASLQYVLEEGNRDGWLDSRTITVLAAVAGVSLVTFIVHELSIDNPVVDFRVFAERSYAASTAINFLVGCALFGGSFLYSLFCGTVMHYTALDIGLVFLEGTWIQLLIMPIIGRLMSNPRVDTRMLVAIGIIGNFISLVLNARLTAQADHYHMILPIFARACSLGLIFVPLSVASLSGLKPSQRGSGAGLFNLTRELGGSIGLAVMSNALNNASKSYYDDMRAQVTPYTAAAQDLVQQFKAGVGGRLVDPATGALAILSGRVSIQALVRAFNELFTGLAIFFALSILLVFLLKPAPKGLSAPAGH